MTKKAYKIKFHPFAKEDIRRMPEDEKEDVLNELNNIFSNPDRLIEKSEPLDMEKLKEEEPELYEELMLRYKELQKGS